MIYVAAGLGIVLVLAGLYMWWPGNGRALGRVLFPNLRAQGRPFWKELHVSLGFISIVLFFFLLSGLALILWQAICNELPQLAPCPVEDVAVRNPPTMRCSIPPLRLLIRGLPLCSHNLLGGTPIAGHGAGPLRHSGVACPDRGGVHETYSNNPNQCDRCSAGCGPAN
nr:MULTISPECIES: PepSY-associated TM helix domain-containing protein [unclassified Mesorhizobium]